MNMHYRWLGELGYADALALQHQVRAEVLNGAPGTLFLLTHPPTITLGRRADPGNVLLGDGCEVIQSDRGGDVTWHGPGQLVGYPVINLGRHRLGVRAYVERLATTLKAAVATYGVRCEWDKETPGLWCDRNKLVAFGVHVRQQVTTHGFALNVCPDLSAFQRIVPCGLHSGGVTSLAEELGSAPVFSEVIERVKIAFSHSFGVSLDPS